MVNYLNSAELNQIKITENPVYGWNKSGYGRKIPTKYMIKLSNNKWYRVYCICFSNVGSLYILKNKEMKYLDVITQQALETY